MPDPCPLLLLSTSSPLSWALHLADVLVWFGSPWGILQSGVAVSTASNRVSLVAAQPWWGLQGSLAVALLLVPPPCSKLLGTSLLIWPVSPCPCAVLWELIKAAALTGLHLPSLVHSSFFLSRTSSSCNLAPLLSEHVPMHLPAGVRAVVSLQ